MIEGSQYFGDDFVNTLNSLGYDKAANTPRWVWDMMVSDMQLALTASEYGANKPTIGSTELQAHGEEELQDIPGTVSASISLNPLDWRNPGEQAWKTVKKWGEGIIDPTDVETKIRGEARRIMLTEDPSTTRFAYVTPEIRKVIGKKAQGIQGAGDVNHLKATGRLYDKYGNDIGNDWVQSVVNFEMNKDSAFFRDDNFFKMERKSLEAVAEEVRQNLGNVAVGSAEHTLAIGFNQRAAFAGAMNNTDKAIKGVTDAISKHGLEGTKGIEKKVEALKAATEDSRIRIGLMRGTISQTELADRCAAAGLKPKAFEGITTRLTGDQLASFNEAVKPYEQILGKVEETVASYGRVASTTSKEQLRNLKGGLDHAQKVTLNNPGLIKGNSLCPSAQGMYLQDTAFDLLGDTGYALQEKFAGANGGLTRVVRANLSHDVHQRELATNLEITNNYLDGKTLKTYMWKRVKEHIFKGRDAPDDIVKNYLTSVHYFGLKINSDKLETETPKGEIARRVSNLIKQSDAYKNVFKVTYINAAGQKITKSVLGGSQFKAIAGISHLDVTRLEGLLDSNRLQGIMNLAANPNASWQDLAAFLGHGDQSLEELKKILGFNPQSFLKNFRSFAKWSEQQGIKTAEETAGFIKGLIAYHNSSTNVGIGIDSRYIGHIQRVSQLLTKVQASFYKTIVGKAYQQIIGIKVMVSHAIAAAFATAVPVLAPLEKVIQIGVRVVLDKVGGIFKALWKGIFRADLGGLGTVVEKTFVGLLKPIAGCFACFGIMGAVGFLVITVIISAIPSSNPGKMGGGSAAGMGGGDVVNAKPDLDPENAPTCPLESYGVSVWSYNQNGTATDPSDDYGHGSDEYQRDVMRILGLSNPPCYHTPMDRMIPGGGICNQPENNIGLCGRSNEWGCPYFGYAVDYVSNSNSNSVYAPKYGDPDEQWSITNIGSANGSLIILTKDDIRINLVHLNLNGELRSLSTVYDGKYLGELYGWPGTATGNRHLHLEMARFDGRTEFIPIKPENGPFCN